MYGAQLISAACETQAICCNYNYCGSFRIFLVAINLPLLYNSSKYIPPLTQFVVIL